MFSRMWGEKCQNCVVSQQILEPLEGYSYFSLVKLNRPVVASAYFQVPYTKADSQPRPTIKKPKSMYPYRILSVITPYLVIIHAVRVYHSPYHYIPNLYPEVVQFSSRKRITHTHNRHTDKCKRNTQIPVVIQAQAFHKEL
jgi:hypothetical protein